MLEVLDGFPDKVLAVCASGTVTGDDYRDILEPEIKRRIGQHGSVRLFYQLGKEWDGFTPGAGWEDTKLGIEHWSAFSRIAVLTDSAWIRHAVDLFAPVMPCPAKVFANAQAQEAKAWITAD